MNRLTDSNAKLLLIGIVAFNVLPHVLVLPIWLTILSISMLIWAALHLRIGVPLPNRIWRWAFCLLGIIGIGYEFSTKYIQDAACALLVYMAVLKLFESTRARDARFIVFICYFLLMAFLLNDQSLMSTLYMALDVLLITSLLFHLNRTESKYRFRSLRPALRLLVLSIPIWIFLFVIFPRFSAQILGEARSESTAGSGFSDGLNPGMISSLIESEQLAFRAKFVSTGTLSTGDMYWRGGVLEFSEGLRWHRTVSLPSLVKVNNVSAAIENEVRYEITREPELGKWIFALETPLNVDLQSIDQKHLLSGTPNTYELTSDYQTRLTYQGRSRTTGVHHDLSDEERQRNLQLPADLSEELRSLAKQVQTEEQNHDQTKNRSQVHTQEPAKVNVQAADSILDPAQVVFKKIDKFYEHGRFKYSLQPGLMQEDGLKTFLLKKKTGFCEHYAAASAVLGRLAGIPSRVVIGYQGGEFNRIGSYWMVRNLDAHAWTEFYSDQERKWIRYDAVAGIAPERINLGGDFNRRFGVDDGGWMNSGNKSTAWIARWSQQALFAFDAASVRYQQFLLQYDFQFQKRLLAMVGIHDFAGWILLGAAMLGLAFGILLLTLFFKRKQTNRDPVLKTQALLYNKLAGLNIHRQPHEGPMTFLQRVEPLLASVSGEELREMTHMFTALRYGPVSNERASIETQWRKKLRRFKPRLRDS